MERVELLLSVYGASPYLGELLASLRAQTCRDFRLLYRVDGTADAATRALLRDFPDSVEVSGLEHLGVVQSYRKLLQKATAPYVMLVDQDDLWYPDKIAVTLAAMTRLERQYGISTPLLVHSDLAVVDRAGRRIARSFWQFAALNPKANRLADLLVQNNVTGCALMANRALLALAEFPPEAICHDWYLALIASAFGHIEAIPDILIDYRQHGENSVGAVSRYGFTRKLPSRRELRARIARTERQAQSFLAQFGDRLSPQMRQTVTAWSTMPDEANYWKRLARLFRYGFRKNDWLRSLGLWWAI